MCFYRERVLRVVALQQPMADLLDANERQKRKECETYAKQHVAGKYVKIAPCPVSTSGPLQTGSPSRRRATSSLSYQPSIATDTHDDGILTLSQHQPSQSTPDQQQSLAKDSSSGESYLRVSLQHNSARHCSISDRYGRRQLSRSLQEIACTPKPEASGSQRLATGFG